jgi:hypothetical protein
VKLYANNIHALWRIERCQILFVIDFFYVEKRKGEEEMPAVESFFIMKSVGEKFLYIINFIEREFPMRPPAV